MRVIIELCLEAPPEVPEIMVLMDVFPVDVPALFGLDVLDSEIFYADNVIDSLVNRLIPSRSSDIMEYDDIWSVTVIRRDSHLCSRMSFPQPVFYRSEQLLKLHCNFTHPSAHNLYSFCNESDSKWLHQKRLSVCKKFCPYANHVSVYITPYCASELLSSMRTQDTTLERI